MKVSGVVFDFGGVMTTTSMPSRVIELAKKHGLDWQVFAKGFNAHRLDYDGGFITLEEMYDLIWRDAGITISPELNEEFIVADTASWLYRNEATREWMRALKARGFKIGILTNMAPKFAAEHFRPKFQDFIELADAVVVSGDERLYKPMPEIYERLRERINLPANELCFIDDVEKNIAGAEACGWRGIRFVSNDQVAADFEKLLEA